MTAQELTTAAAKLREIAAKVPPADDDTTSWAVHFGHYGASNGLCDGDAAWITLMHPGLAEPLAALLDDTAALLVENDPFGEALDLARFELAIARAINGTTP
jgi:hypothetical protein